MLPSVFPGGRHAIKRLLKSKEMNPEENRKLKMHPPVISNCAHLPGARLKTASS